MMRTDWLLLRPTQEELEGLRRFLGNKAVDVLLDDILEESLQYVEERVDRLVSEETTEALKLLLRRPEEEPIRPHHPAPRRTERC